MYTIDFLTGNNAKKSKLVSHVLMPICMLFSVGIGLWLTRIGICAADEPYHFMNAYDWKNDLMAPLNVWGGYLFGNLVDWKWWCFRVLGWIFCMGAILFSTLFLVKKVENKTAAWLICSLLFFLASVQGTFQMLWGWDGPTFCFTSLTLIAWLNFKDRQNVRNFCLLLVSSFVLGWMRIPNLVVVALIPFLFVVLLDSIPVKTRLYWASLYLIIYIILSVLLLCFLYGSPVSYWDGLSNQKIDEDGYHVSELLLGMFASLIIAIQIAAVFGMVYIICASIVKWKGNFSREKIYIIHFLAYLIITLALLVWMTLRAPFLLSNFSNGFFLLATIFIFCHRNIEDKWFAFTLLAFAIIPCVGSNTGLAKMCTFGVLPIVIGWLWGLWSQPWVRNATYCILAAYTTHTMWQSANNSFGDVGFRIATSTIMHPRFEMMLTSDSRAYGINEVINILSERGLERTLVIGEDHTRYMYEYICFAPNSFLRGLFDAPSAFDSQEYVEYMEKEINKGIYTQVLYVNGNARSVSTSTLVSSYLDRVMNRAWQKNGLIIYEPK